MTSSTSGSLWKWVSGLLWGIFQKESRPEGPRKIGNPKLGPEEQRAGSSWCAGAGGSITNKRRTLAYDPQLPEVNSRSFLGP